MVTEDDILQHLANQEAVLTGSHFIYTSEGPAGKKNHGTAYINMRRVGHQAEWLQMIGYKLADAIEAEIGQDEIDLVVGPETLGRTLAGYTATRLGVDCVWCDMNEEDGRKWASFSEKLDFKRLVPGKRCAITDDLLTTGGSVRQVAKLITELGGVPVIAATVVRRTPDVTAEDCGTDELVFLADVPGFVVMTEEQCQAVGPCSRKVPVVLRPGHGHKWVELDENKDYPRAE